VSCALTIYRAREELKLVSSTIVDDSLLKGCIASLDDARDLIYL
jgi:hypothetical protein